MSKKKDVLLEKLMTLNAYEFIMLMVNGLRKHSQYNIEIGMGTFGCVGEDELCFGCAGTCALIELLPVKPRLTTMKIIFEDNGKELFEEWAKYSKSSYDTVTYFELAMDYLRRGHIYDCNDYLYKLDLPYRIEEPRYWDSERFSMATINWEERLHHFEDLANYNKLPEGQQ